MQISALYTSSLICSHLKKVFARTSLSSFPPELICGFIYTAFGRHPSFAKESFSTKGCKAYSLRKVPYARVVSETWNSFFGMDIGRNWRPSCMSLCNIMLRIIIFFSQGSVSNSGANKFCTALFGAVKQPLTKFQPCHNPSMINCEK